MALDHSHRYNCCYSVHHPVIFFTIFLCHLFTCATSLSIPLSGFVFNETSLINFDQSSIYSQRGANASRSDELLTPDSLCKCGKPYKWWNPLFQPDDCEGALGWLYIDEMAESPLYQTREFVSPYGKGKTKNKSERTPRKYTFRR